MLSLFALSLDLIVGYAGIVSLGHTAYFGTGAYAAAILASNGWQEPLSALAVAAVWALVRPGVPAESSGAVVMPGGNDTTEGPTPGDTAAGSPVRPPPDVAPSRSGSPGGTPVGANRLPPLPSPEAITSADPAVREAARLQILRLSSDTSLPPELRASAAFGLAEQARLDGMIEDRIHYLELAMRLNPTPRYRDLLARARHARDSISP